MSKFNRSMGIKTHSNPPLNKIIHFQQSTIYDKNLYNVEIEQMKQIEITTNRTEIPTKESLNLAWDKVHEVKEVEPANNPLNTPIKPALRFGEFFKSTINK